MQQDREGDQQDDEQSGGGLNVEMLRSYLAFAGRALKRRKLLLVAVAVVGLALTGLIAKYAPRTYTCITVLSTMTNSALDSDRGPQPLAGAENQIMSHENLEALIRDTDLKKKYFARRPPLLALKDKLILTVFGPMNDRVLNAVLLGTIESKLTVKVEKDTLSISVDWSDRDTAAELAEAAKNVFLRVRHNAEISAFQEKMAILDTHAGSLRDEIDVLAEQMRQRMAEKKAELTAEAKAERQQQKADAPDKPAPRVVVTSRQPVTDEQLPELRQRVLVLKQNLANAENQRNTRIDEEQAKLNELQLRLTPNHPQVITQQERVGIASQVPSELALMRAEESDLESQIRQREAMAKSGSTSERILAAENGTNVDALPTEVLGLLDERDADPALAAQISGAVVRYGSLRDDVRGAKLALDTATAAFNRRYRVVIPVEVPDHATKPKVGVIVGVGLFLTLLLSLLLPILIELRQDVVVESWQVHQLQLPVLGELYLPERNQD